MRHLKTGVLATTVLLIASVTSPAFAASGVKVGVLNCTVQGGVGLIFGSRKPMNCTFKRSGGGSEHYTGSVSKVGLDIGVTTKSYISWAVFAPGKLKPGSLAGTYGGGSAEATLGLGLGANVLIGGSKNSIALQPLSVQGQKGLNLAVGIAGLRLRHAGS
jgi:uncharacterized protein DUF992